MIAFLTLLYLGLLGILVALKILPNRPVTWGSTIVWVVLLFVVLFIPMQWGAPSGPARILTFAVEIVPNVAGPVSEVAVEPNVPVDEGEVLFRIDRTPFAAAVDAVKAELDFQKLRLEQFQTLAERDAGTRFRVEETAATLARLEAELQGARWQLEQTVVRAPADGFVTFLALRPGQRVVPAPVRPAMIFVETEERLLGVQIEQIYLRHVRPGQPVEVAFKTIPGRIFAGAVEAVVRLTAEGQARTSGSVPVAGPVRAEPFFVRVRLDAPPPADALPPGSAGTAAIYTDTARMTHVIRKITLRIQSKLDYVVPWL